MHANVLSICARTSVIIFTRTQCVYCYRIIIIITVLGSYYTAVLNPKSYYIALGSHVFISFVNFFSILFQISDYKRFSHHMRIAAECTTRRRNADDIIIPNNIIMTTTTWPSRQYNIILYFDTFNSYYRYLYFFFFFFFFILFLNFNIFKMCESQLVESAFKKCT